MVLQWVCNDLGLGAMLGDHRIYFGWLEVQGTYNWALTLIKL